MGTNKESPRRTTYKETPLGDLDCFGSNTNRAMTIG